MCINMCVYMQSVPTHVTLSARIALEYETGMGSTVSVLNEDIPLKRWSGARYLEIPSAPGIPRVGRWLFPGRN